MHITIWLNFSTHFKADLYWYRCIHCQESSQKDQIQPSVVTISTNHSGHCAIRGISKPSGGVSNKIIEKLETIYSLYSPYFCTLFLYIIFTFPVYYLHFIPIYIYYFLYIISQAINPSQASKENQTTNKWTKTQADCLSNWISFSFFCERKRQR